MRLNILFLSLLFTCICHAQKVTQIDNNHIRIKGDTIIYFDAEQRPITKQAHADSLSTHRYIISIKGTDKITEIHLTYKHPRLETLLGKTLPLIDFSDINGKVIKMDQSELTALDVLADDYSNIRFIALTPDSCEEVRQLMKKLHLEWENVSVVPDYKSEYDDVLHIYVYPSNVIIDKNGVIKGAKVGSNTRQLLRTLERLDGDC